MTKVSLYLESQDKFLEEFSIDTKPKNIEDARLALIENLSGIYSQTRYEVKLNIPWDFSYPKIDVIFDRSLEINRDFLIDKVLKND